MSAPVVEEYRQPVDLPRHWPTSLHPRVLGDIDLPTPFLATDLGMLADRLRAFTTTLPQVKPFYAVKCNSAPEVLHTIADQGASFEIASLGELRMLQELDVDPAEVLYSNTVKPASHVSGAAEAGVWRFAADSEDELRKIARAAPGSAVYIRVRVDDSGSVFPLSRKFGAEAHHARSLLLAAQKLGLQPYGLTFHVGSQCMATSAWVQAIASMGRLMSQLQSDGIRLEMLDIGGGFPARYDDPVPAIGDIGRVVSRAIEQLLPYQPALIAAEPGRHLVAETAVMVASVLGREERAGRGVALPRRGRLPRSHRDTPGRRPVAVPALVLALRPRRGGADVPSPSPVRRATAQTRCSTARRSRSPWLRATGSTSPPPAPTRSATPHTSTASHRHSPSSSTGRWSATRVVPTAGPADGRWAGGLAVPVRGLDRRDAPCRHRLRLGRGRPVQRGHAGRGGDVGTGGRTVGVPALRSPPAAGRRGGGGGAARHRLPADLDAGAPCGPSPCASQP